MDYALPTEINCGYLTVPKFMAAYLANRFGGDLDGHTSEDIHTAIAQADLKVPMVEMRFTNGEMLPEVVRLLTNCEIPYHYNFTVSEYIEFDYYFGLNSSKKLQGCDSSLPSWQSYEVELDEAVLNNNLQKLVTQFKLLNNDFDALFESREINNYDFRS